MRIYNNVQAVVYIGTPELKAIYHALPQHNIPHDSLIDLAEDTLSAAIDCGEAVKSPGTYTVLVTGHDPRVPRGGVERIAKLYAFSVKATYVIVS